MNYFCLQFLDNKFVAVSTDMGTVKLYRIIGENEAAVVHLEEVAAWKNLHFYGYVNNYLCGFYGYNVVSICFCI